MPHSGPSSSGKLALLTFFFFLCVYLMTARGYYGSDHFYSYMTAESLVRRGTLALSEQLSAVSEIRERQETALRNAIRGSDGRLYTKYGIAMPLAMVPAYWLGHVVAGSVPGLPHDFFTMFAVSLTNVVITALTCLVLLLYAQHFSFSPQVAFVLALLYGLGTMAWNYSQYSFAEPLLVLFFLSALLTLDTCSHASSPSVGHAALTGAFVGFCLLTEVYSSLIIAAGVCGYLVYVAVVRWKLSRRTFAALVAFGLCLLPSLAFLIHFGLLRFGHFAVGHRLGGDLSVAFIPVALYGYVFSSGKSIFLYCPVLILSFWGWRSFIAQHKAEAVLFAAIGVGSVLTIASWVNYWNGDLAWGPRFLFHLVPLLLLPIGQVLQSGQWRHWPPAGLVTLGLYTAAVQFASILVNLGHYHAIILANGLTDRFFTPYVSPIVGHWLLIISTIQRSLTGRSLTVLYPGAPYNGLDHLVDFTGYDGIDLWAVNVYAQVPGRLGALLITIGVVLLLLLAGSSFYLLVGQLRHSPTEATS